MNLPTIEREDDTIWMIQDLWGLTTYEKAKAIVDFCDKETKLFEKAVDRAIMEIFDKNGVNISSTSKSALKLAFDTLKRKGIDIQVDNVQQNLFGCEEIKKTKLFSIYLEDDRYLQVCVRVREKKL